MVVPHGGIGVMFPVTLEVAWHSWRLLGAPRRHSAILEVVQVCIHGDRCLLGPTSEEVTVVGLLFTWR